MAERTIQTTIPATNDFKFNLSDPNDSSKMSPVTMRKVQQITAQVVGTLGADTLALEGSLTGVDTQFFALEDNSGAIILSAARLNAQIMTSGFGPLPYVRVRRIGAAGGAVQMTFEIAWPIN